MFGVALRKKRDDAPLTQTLADWLSVITTNRPIRIEDDAVGFPGFLQAWDSVKGCEGLLRIIEIGSGQLNGERNPATFADQMTLAAQLGAVGWIRSCQQPSKTARPELPSTTARAQSISPERARQSGVPRVYVVRAATAVESDPPDC
jgi:hypothetical protein